MKKKICRFIFYPIWPIYALFCNVLFHRELKILERLHEKAEDEAKDEAAEVLKNVKDNIWKHVIIFVILAVAVYTTLPAIKGIAGDNSLMQLLLIATIGFVTLMGVAWYVISFGAVPKAFLKTAFMVTFFLFLAFGVSLVLVAEVLAVMLWPVSHTLVIWIIIAVFAVYVASIVYDTMDLLKAGVEDASFRFYRVGKPGMEKQSEILAAILEQNKLLSTSAGRQKRKGQQSEFGFRSGERDEA